MGSEHVVDFPIDLGAQSDLTVEWQAEDGEPIDLTGATARAHFRTARDDASALLELTDADGIALGADGSITLSVSPAASAALSGARGVYDVEVTLAGVPFRVFGGRYLPSIGVTR